MNIALDWHDPQHTLLHLRLEGRWDMNRSRVCIADFKQRVREVPHRVDLIAEAVDRDAMNPPVWVLRLGVHGIMSAPPNTGWIVIVPNNTMLLALVHAGLRVLGERYEGRIHSAATFDDAHQLIGTSR
ncbi:MAG: hypothetical protein U0521_05470 [Anaerolineae bacterium]